MSEVRFPVSEVLRVNNDAIVAMMEGGTHPGTENLLFGAELPSAIEFGVDRFSCIAISRFQASDPIEAEGSIGESVPFAPALAFTL